MSSFRLQKNVEKVLIAKDVAVTATKVSGPVALTSMPVGEIAIVSPGGVCLDTTTILTHPKIRIGVRDANGELNVSDDIVVSTIKNYKGKKSVAAAEQVDYVGYDGTSGEIDVINNNLYLLRLHFSGDTEKTVMDQLIKYGVYESDSTATQSEIAAGLVASLYYNTKNETEYRVKAERVTNGTPVVIGTGCNAVTFTQGSKFFTVGDIDDATGATALAVGDVIISGTTNVSPSYIIAAIDTATNIGTLDTPYAGPTVTHASDVTVTKILAANVAVLHWGIKITGIAKDWVLGQKPYNKVMWTVNLTDFGATTVTNSVAAKKGNGVYEQVAEAEWFAQGFEGGMSYYKGRAFAPGYTARASAESGHFYNTLSFDFANNTQSEIGPVVVSPKSMVIFLNSGTAANTGCTATSITGGVIGFVELMDALVTGNKFVGTVQTGNLV